MNPNDPHDWLLKAERDLNLALLAPYVGCLRHLKAGTFSAGKMI
jgi:hypothetical protein